MTTLAPARKTSDAAEPLSYARIAAALRAMILSGEAAPGEWLRMPAIADRFGVSVQPVREALQQLQGDGLIEFLPNRGARVRGVDRARIVHIFEIREAIESFMSGRFAEEASRRDIRELEQLQVLHDKACAARDRQRVSAVNREFHTRINGHGDNAEALAIVERHYALTGLLHARKPVEPSYWRTVRADHHALIAAFLKRDAATAAAIGARHVRARREEMLSWLDSAPGAPPLAEHGR
jgi:DNA-binding GntR family transcriptional regulator